MLLRALRVRREKNVRLSLKTRILLVISIGITIAFFVIMGLNYSGMKQSIFKHRLEEAENIKNILMATRRVYHHQFLASGIPLTDKTLGFLPAYAMGNISKDFNSWSDSGMTFNNVSDRPRNPDNAADKIELMAMDYFRKNPDKNIRCNFCRLIPVTIIITTLCLFIPKSTVCNAMEIKKMHHLL